MFVDGVVVPLILLGFGPQQVMRPQAMTPAGASRPPNLPTQPTADGARLPNQQKSRAPVLDGNFANQLDNGEYSADSKLQDSTTAGKKAFSLFLSWLLQYSSAV